MKKNLYLTLFVNLFLTLNLLSFNNNHPYQSYFEEAYQANPEIPQGILEAVAFAKTRMYHIVPTANNSSSIGMPEVFGVMGLIDNGKGVFKNNLKTVSQLSGYSIEAIKNDPRINILAYAKAYNLTLNQQEEESTIPKNLNTLTTLDEIPVNSSINDFAMNSYLYEVLQFLDKEENQIAYNFPNHEINYTELFGVQNYNILSATTIQMDQSNVYNEAGNAFQTSPLRSTTDYPDALWEEAAPCNYNTSRNGDSVRAVVAHVAQGTYAGSIAWSKNCESNVSWHYIVRSSDGQITQQVLEEHRAYHIGIHNNYTIGIMHEGFIDDPSWFTDTMYVSSANLVKDIVTDYNINSKSAAFGRPCASNSNDCELSDCTMIKGQHHYSEQTHSYDPGPHWDWNKYDRLINENLFTQETFTNLIDTLYDSGGSSEGYESFERNLQLITINGAYQIQITFDEYDLGNEDMLIIYDGSSWLDDTLGIFDQAHIPTNLTSTGPNVLFDFRSNCENEGLGYQASYQSVLNCDLLSIDFIVTASNSGQAYDVTTNVQNAAHPVTYQWSNGSTMPNLQEVDSGTYYITITDTSGCTLIDTLMIDESYNYLFCGLGNYNFIIDNIAVTDETAQGAQDGSITIGTSSGVTPITYIISNGNDMLYWTENDSSYTFNNLTPGNYDILVIDDNGCDYDSSIIVSPFGCSFLANIELFSPVTCHGEHNGALVAETSNGVSPYTYEWSNGGTDSFIENLEPDNYSVTITDALGCIDSDSYTLTEPEELTLTWSNTDETTSGANNGTITLTGAGGTLPYHFNLIDENQNVYSFNGLSNQVTITGLSAGLYTAFLQDTNGCPVTISVYISLADCDMQHTLTVVNESFPGANDGSIATNVINGVAPIFYSWSTGSENSAITNISQGTYTVTISDFENCIIVDTVTVSADSSCMYTVDSVSVLSDGCTSDIYIHTSFVTLGEIDSVLFNEDFNEGIPDSWTLINNDGANPGVGFDWITDAWAITQDVDSSGFPDSVAISTSYYSPPDTADDWLISPAIYLTNNNVLFWQAMANDPNYPDGYEVRISTTGTDLNSFYAHPPLYTTTGENGYWTDRTINLTNLGYENQTVYIAVRNNSYHLDALMIDNIRVYEVNQQGLSYLWSTGDTTSYLENIGDGNYSITITDTSGCSWDTTISINNINDLELTLSHTNETSPNADDGTASVSVSGGEDPYNFIWSNNETSDNINNLSPGWYYVTVIDFNGCLEEDSVYIEPAQFVSPCDSISISIIHTNETSPGANDGTASATGINVQGNHSFTWSNGEMTTDIDSLSPGWYSVTLTLENDSSCMVVDSVEILAADSNTNTHHCNFDYMVLILHESAPNANDGIATVQVSGGIGPFLFDWSDGQTGEVADGLEPGNYYVIITDLLQCNDTAYFTILPYTGCNNLTLSATSTDETSLGANDGTATALASGGNPPYSFEWNTGASSTFIDNLEPGTYTVTLTDDSGCVAIDSTIVLPGDSINTSCNWTYNLTTTDETSNGAQDGTASVDITNGSEPYAYYWSTGATTQNINNLQPGDYTVTISDSLYCSDTISFTIHEFDPCSSLELNVSATNETDVDANDGSATALATGGNPPYSISWNTGDSSSTITNLEPGIYIITLTDDSGCIQVDSVEVLEYNPCQDFNITISSTDETGPSANDGTASVSASGGDLPYSYIWSNNETTANINNLAPGTYEVTVTDNNGCSSSASTDVLPYVECQMEVTVTTTDESFPSANDGVASTSIANGTAPYQYLWSNGDSTVSINGLTEGSYTLTVVDNEGCSDTVAFMINVSDSCTLEVNVSVTHETAPNAEDGTASTTITNGTGPFMYNWSTGDSTASVNNLPPGSYNLTVTDSIGCSDIANFTIDEFTSIDSCNIELLVSVTPETATNANDGTASTTINGGEAPYQFNWSTGDSTASLNNLEPGDYSVTVIDHQGCSDTVDFTIDTFTGCNLMVGITSTDESAPGAEDGTATVDVSNGIPPYTYLWSTGASTAMITNLGIGTYTVTVWDADSCENTASVNISTIGCDLSVALTSSQESYVGANDGTASAFAQNGLPPYTYAWNNGGTQDTILGLEPGTYNITVTDSLGCIATSSIVVNSAACMLAIETSGTDITDSNLTDGTASVNVMNGSSPFTFSWSNGASTDSLNNLAAGNYYVTVVDSLGCTEYGVVTVNPPGCDVVLTLESTNETSLGNNDGTATAIVTGGSGIYTYDWNIGETSSSIHNLPGGTYNVIVTDTNGCQASGSIDVHACALEASIGVTNVSTSGATDGSLTAFVSGGSSPYSYDWGTLGTSATVENVGEGTYTLVITDGKGCIDSTSATVQTADVGFEDIFNNAFISVYPNPTKGIILLSIELKQHADINIQIENYLGQPVYAQNYERIQQISKEINGSTWAKGIYIIKVQSQGYTKIEKLIVQ